MANTIKRTAKKLTLKLQAFRKKTFINRLLKQIKATRPKGMTITGPHIICARPMPTRDYNKYLSQLHKAPTGQKKIRKLARQTNRKTA